jgi:hypothetical protein
MPSAARGGWFGGGQEDLVRALLAADPTLPDSERTLILQALDKSAALRSGHVQVFGATFVAP